MKSVLYTIRDKAGNSANETIDIVLVSGIMEQSTAVVFLDDGVYQLTSNLQSIRLKDTKMKWLAVPTYGIDNVYVLQDSLRVRRIEQQELPDWVKPIDQDQYLRLLHTSQFVIGD